MYQTNIDIKDGKGRAIILDLLVDLDIAVDHKHGWHELLSVSIGDVKLDSDQFANVGDPLHKIIYEQCQAAFMAGKMNHLFLSDLPYIDHNAEHRLGAFELVGVR